MGKPPIKYWGCKHLTMTRRLPPLFLKLSWKRWMGLCSDMHIKALHPHFIHLHWRVKANYPTTFLVNKDFLEHFCQQILFFQKNLSCSYQICSGPILELLSSLCLVYLVKEAVNIFALPSQVPGGRWEREEAIEFKFLVFFFLLFLLPACFAIKAHQSATISILLPNISQSLSFSLQFPVSPDLTCFCWHATPVFVPPYISSCVSFDPDLNLFDNCNDFPDILGKA